MIRIINALSLAIAALAAFGLYKTSYHAKEAERELAQIEMSILQEKELARMLEAEWAHLNAPAVLQARAERYLDLAPVDAHQLASWTDVERAFSGEGLPQERLYETVSAPDGSVVASGSTIVLPRSKPAPGGAGR